MISGRVRSRLGYGCHCAVIVGSAGFAYGPRMLEIVASANGSALYCIRSDGVFNLSADG